MAKERYNAFQLFEEILTETTISCGNCEESSTVMEDGMEAAEIFFHDGWRVTKTKCYCPSCVSKKLKINHQ